MKKTVGMKIVSENEKMQNVKKFLKTVSDNNRLRILLVLGDKSMNVSEIHRKLKLPQNLTSHHISKLKKIGLLDEKREGTFRHYSVNFKKIKEYSSQFNDLIGL